MTNISRDQINEAVAHLVKFLNDNASVEGEQVYSVDDVVNITVLDEVPGDGINVGRVVSLTLNYDDGSGLPSHLAVGFTDDGDEQMLYVVHTPTMKGFCWARNSSCGLRDATDNASLWVHLVDLDFDIAPTLVWSLV